MKKFLVTLMTAFLTNLSLLAAPKAVVFDFGGVMTGEPKKEAVVQFLRSTFYLSEAEFERSILKKGKRSKLEKMTRSFGFNLRKKKELPYLPIGLRRSKL